MSPETNLRTARLTQIVFALGLDLLFQGLSMPPILLARIRWMLAATVWMMASQG